MIMPTLTTKFAPPERGAPELIERQWDYFQNMNLLDPVLSAVPDMVLVLNEYRQIVYGNEKFMEAFDNGRSESIIGMRPGEAIRCVHADDEPAGCGTSEFCSTCGAAKAILQAQGGKKNVQECRISIENEDEASSLDLRVMATPMAFQDEQFTIFSITDIGSEKRRQVLERIFFHDIINTAGAIRGVVDLMTDIENYDEFREYGLDLILNQASTQLVDELQAQRQLLAAERGDLHVVPQMVPVQPLLQKVAAIYSNHHVADNKFIKIDPDSADVSIWSDHALLGRVIGNMTKNALEASAAGDTVTIGVEQMYEYVRFWVHNPAFMPRRIQLQVFQRSFSTKGADRGLGTYSMKLLSENYLQGRVSFESTKENGTTFSAMYPMDLVSPIEENE